MLRITTTLVHNDKGTPKIVAKATLGGKVRQKTTNYDHGLSHDRNHGEAAGNLLLANALDVITGGLSREALDRATHGTINGATHKFVIPA